MAYDLCNIYTYILESEFVGFHPRVKHSQRYRGILQRFVNDNNNDT